MGKSSFISISCKQKINCESSCETELVAVDDCIGHVLRLRHFLLAQGYKPAQTIIILQDNRSAILLEQNDIMSSTKRTKHINVRYYFVKSRIDAGEVIVQWYSGEKIIDDFFSKLLTGSKFLRFRGKIMNYKLNISKYHNSKMVKSKNSKEDQNKENVAMVSVGMKKQIKSGYWSKKPGMKAVFVSPPARQPARKRPIMSRRVKLSKTKSMVK